MVINKYKSMKGNGQILSCSWFLKFSFKKNSGMQSPHHRCEKISTHVYRVVLSGKEQIHGVWTCEIVLKIGVPTRELMA